MRNSFFISLLGFFFLAHSVSCSSKESFKTENADTLKIMSYNVRNCKGLDNVIDYKRTASIINRINADFIALQELDSATERSNKVVVLNELAAQTKLYPIFRGSIDYQGGKYGIGILSKEKPIRSEAIPLPGKEEKRSLLVVEMEKYVFCCTHLSLTQADRAASVELINNVVKKYSKPVFLAGDMNCEKASIEMSNFAKNWDILNNPAKPTIPADNPKKCIDFLLARKNVNNSVKVLTSVVENEPVASDHLPVWVKVVVSK